jgi:hypothetical protein
MTRSNIESSALQTPGVNHKQAKVKKCKAMQVNGDQKRPMYRKKDLETGDSIKNKPLFRFHQA